MSSHLDLATMPFLAGGCPEFCVNGVEISAASSGLFFELDSKASQRRLPIPNRHRPFLTDVAECQIEQFERGGPKGLDSQSRCFKWKEACGLSRCG